MICKLLGLGAIVLACTVVGVCRSVGFVYRVKQLQMVLLMLEKLKTYIRYSHMRVDELVRALVDQFDTLLFLQQTATLLDQGVVFPMAWSQGLQRAKQQMQLKQEDITCLEQLGSIIGASDVDNQLSETAVIEQMVEQNLGHASQEAQTKTKLYRSLGLLVGLLLALILV